MIYTFNPITIGFVLKTSLWNQHWGSSRSADCPSKSASTGDTPLPLVCPDGRERACSPRAPFEFGRGTGATHLLVIFLYLEYIRISLKHIKNVRLGRRLLKM